MKQVLQDLSSGDTLVIDGPVPRPRTHDLIIVTRKSLLSAGTERMLVAFGRAGLIEKARQQPDKVRQVLDKVRTDGLLDTFQAVRSKLSQPIPMGYCNSGVVVDKGASVTDFSIGDRVVSTGPHAEYVRVPRSLCARIPDAVDDEAAPFAVLGAVALQGLRLAAPTFGETFAVSGLGLIGLLAVQLLRASGCRVLALDFDQRRVDLAAEFGAIPILLAPRLDAVDAAVRANGGRGVDGVLVAAATDSSEPIQQAARMSRQRGRIVLLGVTGLELSRADFYEKELTFQVSCSYGPGRYDPEYEEGGLDYPVGFVRWTAQRNFEAALGALAMRSLQVASLITHRMAIADASCAYGVLAHDRAALGIVLEYADPDARTQHRAVVLPAAAAPALGSTVGAIGGGNYAGRVLLPALRDAGFVLDTLVTTGSPQSAATARRLGFARVTTDPSTVLGAAGVNLVVIATRHDSHALYVESALRSGKHVFVEKPLAVSREQLARLEATVQELAEAGRSVSLTVGFNRRFSPHVQRARDLLSRNPAPKTFVYVINAGTVPPEHWTQGIDTGGGRLVGEACHFIDLLRYLAGAPIESCQAVALGDRSRQNLADTVSITLRFSEGSVGTIHYLANGARAFPKERLEIFSYGRVLRVDNFRRLEAFGWTAPVGLRTWRQDKGQRSMAAALARMVSSGGDPLIPIDELFEVSRTAIDCAEQVFRS